MSQTGVRSPGDGGGLGAHLGAPAICHHHASFPGEKNGPGKSGRRGERGREEERKEEALAGAQSLLSCQPWVGRSQYSQELSHPYRLAARRPVPRKGDKFHLTTLQTAAEGLFRPAQRLGMTHPWAGTGGSDRHPARPHRDLLAAMPTVPAGLPARKTPDPRRTCLRRRGAGHARSGK